MINLFKSLKSTVYLQIKFDLFLEVVQKSDKS